jgi:hypothetical protein
MNIDINRKVLPDGEKQISMNAENFLKTEIEKLDNLIIQAKSTYNRAEYNLSILIDKRKKMKSVKYAIQCLCMGNEDKIFTAREIHRYTNIPMRTIEVHIRQMLATGMLEFEDRRKYRMVKGYIDVDEQAGI